MMAYIDAAQMRDLLRYEPDTGKLFWLPRWTTLFTDTGPGGSFGACARWNARYAGTEAFTASDGKGYRQGRIFNRTYRAQRVIWVLQMGEWPALSVDHINGEVGDNRWSNLRLATKSQNACNSKVRADSASGVRGVHFDARRNKYTASICINQRERHLGSFISIEQARAAYAEASAALHGPFGRVA